MSDGWDSRIVNLWVPCEVGCPKNCIYIWTATKTDLKTIPMEKKGPKAIKIKKKWPNWRQKGAEREPEEPKGDQNATRKGPKWSQKLPKKERKANQNGAKRDAKREPKGNQSASRNRYPKKVAKMECASLTSWTRGNLLAPFWSKNR